MTTKKAKLRYVNEAVGAMVLVAVSLFILGLLLAGKAQGWFEGRVEIHAVFMAAEGKPSAEQGSFDLQEGDEVKIRSARAGRVKSIEPLDDGGLKAVLEIKQRFHRYVSVDSVARVKKMFGLAGDTHIEISEGQKGQIADGGSIPCYKDEELMEIAKKAVAQLEAAVVPMVHQTSGVMSNANKIAGDLSTGDGLIGAMITDASLTSDVRAVIDRLDELLAETSETVLETRRLIKGAQKHWLIRKYVSKDDGRGYISPLYGFYARGDDGLYRNCEAELNTARLKADARDTARAAYNMAACMYSNGEREDAAVILREAELSGGRDALSVAHHEALRALLYYNDPGSVGSFVSMGILDHAPRGMDFKEHSEFIAAAYLLLCWTGDKERAEAIESDWFSKVKKKGSGPARAAFYQGKARLEESPELAAELCDMEAEELSATGLSYGVAKALERGGAYSARAEQYEVSSLRYLAAAKSLFAQGLMQESRAASAKSLASAQHLDNKALATHVSRIQDLLLGQKGK